jgi:glutaminyl-peptide cyclotransferase
MSRIHPAPPAAPVLLLLAALGASACGGDVPIGTIEILERLPHDREAYTQGLVFTDGVLYESTGKYGDSDVRRVDPTTGEVLAIHELGEEHFGEGLALVDSRLLQLTWRERIVLSYDTSLAAPDTLEFASDGWGACYDGETLWTTSGGSVMFARDPGTLASTGQLQVVRGGSAVFEVNELECVGEHIYANVYQTNDLIKIDKETGEVVAVWDLAGLVPPEFAGAAEEVPNGVAFDPASDSFFLTGKWWPVMYRVRLVE